MNVAHANRLQKALEPLPTVDGGALLVLAAGGRDEAAVALLSTAEVHYGHDHILIALLAASSVVRQQPHWAVLVVPAGDGALRAFMRVDGMREVGRLRVLDARLVDVRPTAEPPWRVHMAFSASTADDATSAQVRYWAALRAWLASGAHGRAPEPPVGS